MKKLIYAVISVLFVGSFMATAVTSATKTKRDQKLRDIQIQSKDIEATKLEVDLKRLNIELKKTLEDKTINDKKVDELEQKIKDAQKREERLQRDLQAKLRDKANKAEKVAQASRTALGTTKAYASSCGDNQYAQKIYMQESGCRLTATNSIGCTGIGQSCPSSKLSKACPDWKTNYICQNKFFTAYAMSYGGWKQAHDFKYCMGSCYSTRTKSTVIKKSIWW